MAAFERILSGFEGIDAILDHIRIGDNVVWQVSSLEDYKRFVLPFATQAIKDGRKLIYIRFGSHEPLLEDMDGLSIYTLRPEDGFEPFTVSVHNIIREAGREAFYVFDSLSDLQVFWAADLMMGNFFQVTCPYLFELDTVAFFPLLRGRHSFDTVARIRETTQLLLDVYSDNTNLYVHPLKVWNRYSPTMFLPHRYDAASHSFIALTGGVNASHFYSLLDNESFGLQDQNLDSWERFFSMCRLRQMQQPIDKATQQLMCSMLLTKDKKMVRLFLRYFTPNDYFLVRDRLVGTGTIGGKACGMLLARAILRQEAPEVLAHMEPHDSYYIGSDIFYTYLVQNNCWTLRLAQRTADGYLAVSGKLKEKMLTGRFNEPIREQFRHILEYFGQAPIIIRSSSLLEDGFGNAFAGKYDSVFCSNMGSLDERLAAFEDAIRTVYASTMNESALEYRRARGLEHKDEQMAILVQRVSGSRFGSLFFPSAAGVGYSYNTYRFQDNQDPNAGMLRLVMGLGTRAVDRTEGDYPRIISLDDPLRCPYSNVNDRHRFSQRNIDVIDLAANRFSTCSFNKLLPKLPLWYRRLVLEHDTMAERRLQEMGHRQDVCFISCLGIAKHRELMATMKTILSSLQEAYEYPVDIEFTINLDSENAFMINLVQCRPLQVLQTGHIVKKPEFDEEHLLFDLSDASMGTPANVTLDLVVLIDPVKYYEFPYSKKPSLARLISEINKKCREEGRHPMLIAPGRIGTSSPELGIPVSFAEINGFSAICEVAESRAGYLPELSYGSHMFQDLIESNILYCAIFESAKTLCYHPEVLSKYPDLFYSLFPREEDYFGIINIYDVTGSGLILSLDIKTGRTTCGFVSKEASKIL